jgi:fatty-acyl-CoA synthase
VKQVYPGRYVPEELLQLRQREGVTYSHCVPTILQMLMDAADRTGADMAGWKMCIGGSALSTGLAKAALQRGIDVYAGYGMSETGPVMSVSRLLDPPGTLPESSELQRRCRAGLPVPLVDLKIVDPSGTAMPHDGEAIGEVVVRAPWTTPCYVGSPQASEELWRGGYLHTQDVGSIDADGFLQLKDRIKDVIKTGGEWISSLTLESLISTHPGVQEVAVVALPDARWGERPHALVVPRAEWRDRLTADQVRNRVGEAVEAGALPKYAIPEQVTFVDALEKTSVGKINKRLLRDRYG